MSVLEEVCLHSGKVLLILLYILFIYPIFDRSVFISFAIRQEMKAYRPEWAIVFTGIQCDIQ